MSNEETVRKTLAAFNSHDVAAFVSAYTDDVSLIDPQYPEPLRGRAAFQKDIEDFYLAFPDIHADLGALVASGDTVAIDGTMSGTHTGPLAGPSGEIPATNKPVSAPFGIFMRFDGQGRITEERRYFDMLGMLGQLGLLPQ